MRLGVLACCRWLRHVTLWRKFMSICTTDTNGRTDRRGCRSRSDSLHVKWGNGSEKWKTICTFSPLLPSDNGSSSSADLTVTKLDLHRSQTALTAVLNLAAMGGMSRVNSASPASLRGGCDVHAACCGVYVYVCVCWGCVGVWGNIYGEGLMEEKAFLPKYFR